MTEQERDVLSKVPAVTLGFWIIKILATTLGETAGDTVTMTMKLGYLAGTAIFMTVLALLVWRQIAARRFHPLPLLGDHRGLDHGGHGPGRLRHPVAGDRLYGRLAAAAGLRPGLIGGLALDHRLHFFRCDQHPARRGLLLADHHLSQTLGTALGDWTADTGGLGYVGAALVFGALLAVVAGLYFWTRVNRVLLFWAAFILTRPLGATVGDFLDKPVDHGGLAFSRPLASAVLAAVIIVLILVLLQRAGRHPGEAA